MQRGALGVFFDQSNHRDADAKCREGCRLNGNHRQCGSARASANWLHYAEEGTRVGPGNPVRTVRTAGRHRPRHCFSCVRFGRVDHRPGHKSRRGQRSRVQVTSYSGRTGSDPRGRCRWREKRPSPRLPARVPSHAAEFDRQAPVPVLEHLAGEALAWRRSRISRAHRCRCGPKPESSTPRRGVMSTLAKPAFMPSQLSFGSESSSSRLSWILAMASVSRRARDGGQA